MISDTEIYSETKIPLENLSYKEMTKADYAGSFKLWKNTEGIGLSEADSVENIGKFLDRNKGFSFVCKKGDRIIGTVLAGHDGRRGYIYHLVTDIEYRRKGIAKELMRRCLERLRKEGIAKCHLFVFRNNESGKRFWNHCGWENRNDIEVFSMNNV